MARSRNIKPSFFTNDDLAELDPLARLLFIGMWTIADYKGDLEWRPRRIKAQVLPYDNCDIEELAINLDKSGFIRYYSNGEKTYVRVTNFNKHQNPHKNEREKGSDIPEYSEDLRQVIDLQELAINRDKSGVVQESSHSDPADSLNLIPDTFNQIPDCGIPSGSTEKQDYSDDDFDFARKMYNSILAQQPTFKKPNLKSWAKTIRLMRERDGRTYEDMQRVFVWARQDNFWKGNILSADKFRKQYDTLTAQMSSRGASYENNQRVDNSAPGRVRAAQEKRDRLRASETERVIN